MYKFKEAMMYELEMTHFGLMKYFLWFQVKQSKGVIIISQENYITNLLKFHMEKVKDVRTPISLNEKLPKDDEKFGGLSYLSHSHKNLYYSLCELVVQIHEQPY